MRSGFPRRNLTQGNEPLRWRPRLLPLATVRSRTKKPWWLGDGMPQESAATPKIACAIDLHDGVTDEAIRSVVQIGVYHVLSGGPAIPWTGASFSQLSTNSKPAASRSGT